MSDHVYFAPYVGDCYWACVADDRLLVLGESHYCDGPLGRDATVEFTNQYVRGEHSGRFWRGVHQVLEQPGEDRTSLFARIGLYEFVQEVVGGGPRVAPTAAMFARSEPAFFEVLRELRPTHVLVCGKRLWDNLPRETEDAGMIDCGAQSAPWCSYDYGNGWSRCMPIVHPSSGRFSACALRPLVARFLSAPGGMAP